VTTWRSQTFWLSVRGPVAVAVVMALSQMVPYLTYRDTLLKK
jgi:hypothetical protein